MTRCFVTIAGNTFFIENKPEYLSKTIQLYEMVLVRHGVMVVGQTCSGKTATIHNLAKAMTKANTDGLNAFSKVQIVTINPKAVTSGQLYGLFDENTHEFVEGILAVTFRRCAKDTSVDRKWMMFDGPVDAVWIEVSRTAINLFCPFSCIDHFCRCPIYFCRLQYRSMRDLIHPQSAHQSICSLK